MTRRNFLQTALAMPIGASFARYQALAAPAQGLIKITRIQALQLRDGRTLIRVDTDSSLSGFGECNTAGPAARSIIAAYNGGGRLPHLGLIGKDPLAIQVHFHNMFYAYAQRRREIKVLSGIDMALWDLAGKILNQPVSKLLGGNFRDEILLYSHAPEGDYLSKEQWRDRAQREPWRVSGCYDARLNLNLSEKAIEDYGRALELKRERAEIYNSRAAAYVQLGQYRRAVDDYSRGIRLRLDNPEPYLRRGMALEKLGKLQEALEDMTRAVEFNPDYIEARLERGFLYGELGQFERAVPDFDRVNELRPDQPRAYGLRGEARLRLEQFAKPIEDFTQAIRLDPANADVYLARGSAHVQRRRTALPTRRTSDSRCGWRISRRASV